MRRALSFLAVALFLGGAPAHATDFVTLGGLNLSSPRTALESSYSMSAFFGVAVGLGFDFKLTGNAHVETEAMYITRRYGGFSSMPTIMVPVIGRFESRYLIVGLGPYLAMVLGETADGNQPATLTGFNTVEAGGVVELGIKLPLTQKLTALIDGRVSRALTASYDLSTGSFYWGQIQAFVGFQWRMSRSSTSAYR